MSGVKKSWLEIVFLKINKEGSDKLWGRGGGAEKFREIDKRPPNYQLPNTISWLNEPEYLWHNNLEYGIHYFGMILQ